MAILIMDLVVGGHFLLYHHEKVEETLPSAEHQVLLFGQVLLVQFVACDGLEQGKQFAGDLPLLEDLDSEEATVFFALPVLGYGLGRVVNSGLAMHSLLQHLLCAWLLIFQEIGSCLMEQCFFAFVLPSSAWDQQLFEETAVAWLLQETV